MMSERRMFPRVRLTAKSFLYLQDANYKGQLQNISISGALISMEERFVVPTGGDYTITIYIEGEDLPLQLGVEVVCSSLSLVGVKFVSCDDDTATRLGQLIVNLTSGDPALETELDTIKIHLDKYLR